MASVSDVVKAFAGVVEDSKLHAQTQSSKSKSKKNASPAQLFAQLAKEHYAQMATEDSFSQSPYGKKNEAQQWKMESSTWDLLERLYSLRLQPSSDNGNEDTEMDGVAGTGMEMDTGTAKEGSAVDTDFTKVQELMRSDSLLSEYVEVRRWLEEKAPEFHPVETRKGYLFYTRKSIRDRKSRAGVPSQQPEKADNTVTEADPDAPSRQRKDLAYEDAEYESSLLRTLYEYVRRGRVGNAMDLCAESDEPWRAASMKGGLLWRDPSLEPEGEDEYLPVSSGSEKGVADWKPSHTAGNINRMLWKQTCAALAHDENNDVYERALYAALGGRLDEVILVCETWEDYLWAYVNTMIEAKIDSGIVDANALYTPAQTTSLDHIQSKYPPIEDMYHVFDSLTEIDSTVLRESAKQPFHLLQKSLITDDFASYIDDYARRLRAGDMSEAECDLLRFVVHAALYLSELGVTLPKDAVEGVLQAYIGILSKNHTELVAVYVTYLPTSIQTESYALFLCGISDPVNVRLQLLRLAERHGLDMNAICKRTTQLTFDIRKAEDSTDMSDSVETSFVLAEPVEAITDEENELVRAVEWVTSSTQLYEYALFEICKLVRRFLLRGRTNAATQLFNSLPDDFVQQNWVKETESGAANSSIVSHFQEYIHLLSLCDAYAYYATWSETLCKRPIDTRVQSSRRQALWLEWKENIAVATERASQMFRNRILDVDWLGSPLGLDSTTADDMDTSGDDAQLQERLQELECLRELYIPETVFRLHSILFETRDALPKNLKRSLDLAQLVADESLGIYRHLAKASQLHPQGRLIAFMGLMRSSAFEILRVQQESQPNKPPLMMDPAIISSSAV